MTSEVASTQLPNRPITPPPDSAANVRSLAEIFDDASDIGIPLMVEGFTSQLHPVMSKVDAQLRQLEEYQRCLMEQLSAANEIVEQTYDLTHVTSTFDKIPKYQAKLQQIRSSMTSLQSLSGQLQKRVSTLKVTKQVYINQLGEIRKKEQAHDQVVAARVVVANPAVVVPPVTQLTAKKKSGSEGKKKSSSEGKKKKKPREVEISEAPPKKSVAESSAESVSQVKPE